MVFSPQACASAANTLARWARNLMRSTSNLFSSYASCSTEWPPAICETPSAIVFLSSGVTASAERPHQGCQRIHQMVQNTRPPPASRKKSRPDNSDLSVPMLFLLQSAIEYAALDFFCWTCQEVSCFRCLVTL